MNAVYSWWLHISECMDLEKGGILFAVTVIHFSYDTFVSAWELSSYIVLVKDVYIILCCGNIFIHF